MRIWIRIFLLSTSIAVVSVLATGTLAIREGYRTQIAGEVRGLMRLADAAAALATNELRTAQYLSGKAGSAAVRPVEFLRATTDRIAPLGTGIEIFTADLKDLPYSDGHGAPAPAAQESPELAAAAEGSASWILRRQSGTLVMYLAAPETILDDSFVVRASAAMDALDSYGRSQLLLLSAAALATVLLLTAAAFVGSRAIAGGLEVLAAQAGAMAGGDYHGRVSERGTREVAAVARGFNRMAENVEAAMTRLRDEKEDRQAFIDDLTHELRTPITSIVGFADHLRRRPYDEALFAESLGRIHAEGLRILSVSEGLKRLLLSARPPRSSRRKTRPASCARPPPMRGRAGPRGLSRWRPLPRPAASSWIGPSSSPRWQTSWTMRRGPARPAARSCWGACATPAASACTSGTPAALPRGRAWAWASRSAARSPTTTAPCSSMMRPRAEERARRSSSRIYSDVTALKYAGDAGAPSSALMKKKVIHSIAAVLFALAAAAAPLTALGVREGRIYAVPTSASAEPERIVPGSHVGPVILSLAKEQVIQTLGKPSMIYFGDTRYTLRDNPYLAYYVFPKAGLCILFQWHSIAAVEILSEHYEFGKGVRVGMNGTTLESIMGPLETGQQKQSDGTIDRFYGTFSSRGGEYRLTGYNAAGQIYVKVNTLLNRVSEIIVFGTNVTWWGRGEFWTDDPVASADGAAVRRSLAKGMGSSTPPLDRYAFTTYEQKILRVADNYPLGPARTARTFTLKDTTEADITARMARFDEAFAGYGAAWPTAPSIIAAVGLPLAFDADYLFEPDVTISVMYYGDSTLIFGSDGKLNEVFLSDRSKYRTTEGIGIGSTQEAVFAAYGAPLKTIDEDPLAYENDRVLYLYGDRRGAGYIYYNRPGLRFYFYNGAVSAFAREWRQPR